MLMLTYGQHKELMRVSFSIHLRVKPLTSRTPSDAHLIGWGINAVGTAYEKASKLVEGSDQVQQRCSKLNKW